jgi:hypothetical protein
MRYAVIVKPGAIGGHVSEIYTLHASGIAQAALSVARVKEIPQKPEILRHLTVMPVSELPEGWDSDELGRGLVTTDLDSKLHGAPGF